jgi:hypothetical protein
MKTIKVCWQVTINSEYEVDVDDDLDLNDLGAVSDALCDNSQTRENWDNPAEREPELVEVTLVE